jgi:hypothetical protein
MNALESRKQLLIAESELNRTHLMREWQTMAGDVHALARKARNIGAITAAAGLLVTGLSSFRFKPSAPAAEKPFWWQTILKGAGMVSSLWLEFRSQDDAGKNK